MQLEQQLRNKLKDKDILLMTHIVLGYPSFDVNREVIKQMVENGVDCIEMQIPFSEPMADGPIILKANQDSLLTGTKVADCFTFAAEIAKQYDIPFLFMTYYNIIFKYGEENFFQRAKECGIKGFIIPDLPPEMGKSFLELADKYQIAPILIFTPTSTDERMKKLSTYGNGFVYCVARRGVTGKKSEFDQNFDGYLARCRAATKLPLAVGFGIQSKEDIEALKGKADMAVIGSRTIKLVEAEGAEAVGPFIAGLR
ncbi:MAG TPA: tryptophan synthase subunit alpha [Desulfocapsa sulfexigens]|nr:tryptophan synthase subunit alpha [Desulfocapsa sulfexigens]